MKALLGSPVLARPRRCGRIAEERIRLVGRIAPRILAVIVLAGIGCKATESGADAAGTFLYVAGFHSGNVVRFDLRDGDGRVVFTLPDPGPNRPGKGGRGDRPRGVAVDGEGRVYVGLRGGSRNVVRYTPASKTIESFTESIGHFGPGLIDFDGRGDLLVAGDVSDNSSVFMYDGQTGALIASMNHPDVQNVVGLVVDEDSVYAAGLFSGAIVKYDLRGAEVPQPTLLADVPRVRTLGMVVGHTGNLFVVEQMGRRIVELDVETGDPIRTFLTVDDTPGIVDIAFDSATRSYFVSTGDQEPDINGSVLWFNEEGSLIGKLEHHDLVHPYGLCVWP